MIELRPAEVDDVRGSGRHYDALYSDDFSGWETGQIESRYLWLLGLLRLGPGETLLDVSCGNGYLLRAGHPRNLQVYGIDISVIGLHQAAGRAPEAGLVCGDAERLPVADDVFDCVANIGSLEHYLDPALAVAETARVLKPGGKALVLVPNAYGLFGNVLHVLRTGDVFVDPQPLQRYGTRRCWERLLTRNGLTVVEVLGYDRELPRTWRDLARYLRHPARLARAMLSPLIPTNLADSLVYLCSVSLESGEDGR